MDSKDILSLAQIENSIGRCDKAIDLMIQLADQKRVFDAPDRQLLVLVFKAAIDPIRETIRILNYYKDPSNGTTPGLANLLNETSSASISDLESICNKGLDLVNNVLLPNVTDPNSRAFYLKLSGDFYRYMLEFSKKDEVMKSAVNAYKEALDVAKNNLNAADPTRLGVVLNYAVFKYDNLSEIEDAKIMIQDAIRDFQTEEDQLTSDEDKKEAINIVTVMQKNLEQWNPRNHEEEDSAEEEYDGHEEEH